MHTQSFLKKSLWTAFLFCHTLIFPPTLSLTTGLSLDRQNWGPFPYTSRGPLLLWESVWEWKRSGGMCVCGEPDMTAEKQSGIQEEIEQRDKQLHCVLVSGTRFEFVFFYFSVCSSSCFLFLFTASRGGWGGSSVFINREDTVAVMHTGWALMKTDALSEEAEARGGLQPAQPALLS